MTTIDLNAWQRLAPMALLFLVINNGARIVRENLFAFAGFGAGFAFLDALGWREFLLGGAGVLLVAILIAMVYYRRFRFRIEGDAIRVRKGLIEQKDTRIRFARVQAVGVSQPFYFRPFGLVRFSLETPGAEQTEVELPGISRDLGLALRDEVARLSVAVPETDEDGSEVDAAETAPEVDPGRLHAPGNGRLFLHGLASNQIWILAGIAGWFAGTMDEWIENWLERTGLDEILQRAIEMGWLVVLAGIVLLVVAMFALSGLLSLIRFHDFRLHDLGDRFVSVGGMLDRREQTVRREKLTGLRLHQTVVGRLIGLWFLEGKQATSKEIDVEPGKRKLLVPAVSDGGRGLVEKLMPGVDLPDHWRPISIHFRRLYARRLGLAACVPAAASVWLGVSVPYALLAALLAVAAIVLLVHRRWRGWGWALDDGMVWVQSGLVGRQRDVFSIDQVQQAAVVASPYQRRHGLATVVLVLPQGEIKVPFLPREHADELANRALFAAETALVHRV